MFVVDTNVLIYAADSDSEFHELCRRRLERWVEQTAPWYLTWPICYEFLRITTHLRVFRKPKTLNNAWQFLQNVLSVETVGVLVPTSRHQQLLCETIVDLPHLRGNILHDVHTAVLMREHGIRDIYTRDTAFSRFRFVNPIDPI